MALKSRNKISVSFSMSSMTDIVFLLLIFFIVISTLISPYGLKVLLPKSSAKTTAKQNVTVTISPEFEYYVNGEPVDVSNLESTLKSMASGQDNPGIILKADKSVPIDFAVKVMDIANRNKYDLVLATKPN